MKKIGNNYHKDFHSTVNVAIQDDRKLRIERWKIELSLFGEDPEKLDSFNLDGLSVSLWIQTLLNNKVLINPVQEEIFESVAVNGNPRIYILQMLTKILESRLPEDLSLSQISIYELEVN